MTLDPTNGAAGSQPIDRLGRPIRDLRISVIDRCNFRCTFCMPADREYKFLPREQLMTFEEIERLVRVFVKLGVRKIRLTGGEPLLRRDIEDLVRRLAATPGIDDLALTTNGVLLGAKAQALADAGLNRVTVSVESLRDDVFGRVNGLGHGVQQVLDGIDAAADAGLGPIKINTVVMQGTNEDEVADIAGYFKERGHIVRFIEFMDVGTVNDWSLDRVVAAGRDHRPDRRALALRAARPSPTERRRRALPLPRRRRRVRRHLLDQPPLLRRLRPGAPLLRRPPLHLPLRRHRPLDTGPPPLRRDGRRAPRLPCRPLARPRGPLLRDPRRTVAGGFADARRAGRDVPHRRLTRLRRRLPVAPDLHGGRTRHV